MINLKKNNTPTRTLVVETIYQSDRNIVLHFDDNRLVGINYWQGDFNTEIFIDFLDLNHKLYNYVRVKFSQTNWWDNYEEFQFLHNSPDYWDILHWIDDRIWEYVSIVIRIEELESEIKKLKEQL